MRSIIRGIPPRSGDRIFSEPSNPSKHATSLADFFWRRCPTEHGTTRPRHRAAVASPDLPSGFWCVAFVHLIAFDGFPRTRNARGARGASFRGRCCRNGGCGFSCWLVVLFRWRRRSVGRTRRTLGAVLRTRLRRVCLRLLRCLVLRALVRCRLLGV